MTRIKMTPVLANMEEADRGWSWVVLVATFGYFMIFGLFLYGVGMVHLVLLEEFDGKSASTAWAGSLYAALVSLGGPLSSILIDKMSCRFAMLLDGLLTTLGCLATAFSPHLGLSIFTYGIVAGVGGGIGYTATMLVVGFNFRRMRSMAISVAVSGVGIGTCILSPIMEIIRDFYGNVGYFIILAGIGLHKCVFATLCRPSKLELMRQQSLETDNEETLTWHQLLKYYARVYTNKLILCFSLSLMLFSAGTYMIFLHLPTYSRSMNHSRTQTAMLLSTCGLSTVISRILTSMAAEKKKTDEIVLYSGSFGLLAIGTFLFPLYSTTYIGLVIFSLLLGSYFGGCYAIMNSINVKLVGVKYLTIATGMELLFCGLGIAVGPVITGAILDRDGTYEHAFMTAAFTILIGAALGMATVVFQPDADKPEVPDVDVTVNKNGDVVNETVSTNMTSCPDKHRKQSGSKIEEKHETESQELLSVEKGACRGGACPSTSRGCHEGACGSPPTRIRRKLQRLGPPPKLMKPTVQTISPEPINFTEEIEKLLKGEEIKFIDEM